ncbi:hypothetical protein OPIT5_13530 [Opitutaceae bacterium TAV5]|nr:hypothetical protein OPIT5_13530 [Opitutaceae bacterium TAV5]
MVAPAKIAAVLDSTCLIGLDNIGRLDVIDALLQPAWAPPAVEKEFGARPAWLQIVPPADRALVASLRMMVDAGESEAIALAQEKGIRVILDDRKARAVAARLGVPVTGTVGLLLKAKEFGVVPLVRPLLDALDASGFHLGPGILAEALRLAGE